MIDETVGEAPPRVLAVVVTYNGDPWLEECLRSLADQILPSLDVVVVDSGSRNLPSSMVQRILPNAEIVRFENNVGFGAAANRALEVSKYAPLADYYLFMHDDVALESDVASLMLATALMSEAGIVGAKGVEWDRPEVLIEVGPSADQFGYPMSGLEEGEIDQGQHDARKESLYVTNACMLVSRTLIERCGLWDPTYFAFSEDIDLCMRARISGFQVLVQPAARYRHAVAMAVGRRPIARHRSVRFYTRRNRLRTIVKNSSGMRIPLLVLFYLGIGLAEMFILIALRRFNEIPSYPRALASFLVSLPDTLRRRRAVQKRRTIPDRRLRPLMVSDLDRARVFFERRLREWEQGTVKFGSRTFSNLTPSALKTHLLVWVRKPTTLWAVGLVVALLLSFRKTLVAPPIASGSLWPFPEDVRALLQDFFSSWRDVGLGSESAPSPGLLLMWLAGVAAFGEAALAQKLLILSLMAVGMMGMARFVGRRTTSAPAKLAAVAVYSLAPLMQAVVSRGELSALAVFAAAPFLIEIALRMLGQSPGEIGDRASTALSSDTMTRDLLRLSLVLAAMISLAPSFVVGAALLMLMLGLISVAAAWDRRESIKRVAWVLGSVPVSLLLLIPWPIEALRPSGSMLAPLFSGSEGIFHAAWSGMSVTRMLFLDPQGRVLGYLVPVALTVGPLLLTGPSRRRETKIFVSLWFGFAIVGGLVVHGLIPDLVASPLTWMVIPLFCVAASAGHLISGIREELPRHALGWRHVAAPTVTILVVLSVLIGWGPQLKGSNPSASTVAAGSGRLGRSISSYLLSTEEQVGDFRVLWLGRPWVEPVRSGVRDPDSTPYLLTGPGGLTMLDAYPPPQAEGEKRLEESIEAMVGRRLHLGGHLLAPASIRLIVVDPRDDELMSALRRQRDVALEQQQGTIAVFRNLNWLPRAVLAPVNLVEPLTSQRAGDRALMLAEWSGGRPIPRRERDLFSVPIPRTRHSQILLGDNFNSGWKADVAKVRLKHSRAFGWSNRFELPPDARGEVRIRYTHGWIRALWLMLEAVIVLIAVLMARGGRREIKGWLR